MSGHGGRGPGTGAGGGRDGDAFAEPGDHPRWCERRHASHEDHLSRPLRLGELDGDHAEVTARVTRQAPGKGTAVVLSVYSTKPDGSPCSASVRMTADEVARLAALVTTDVIDLVTGSAPSRFYRSH